MFTSLYGTTIIAQQRYRELLAHSERERRAAEAIARPAAAGPMRQPPWAALLAIAKSGRGMKRAAVAPARSGGLGREASTQWTVTAHLAGDPATRRTAATFRRRRSPMLHRLDLSYLPERSTTWTCSMGSTT